MADEITYSVSLGFNSPELGVADLAVLLATSSPNGISYVKLPQLIATTETVIELGDIATPGYAMFVNRNITNYVDLKVAASGAIFARLDPDTNGDGKGGVAFLKLGSGAQAPVGIAHTTSCLVDVFIIKA